MSPSTHKTEFALNNSTSATSSRVPRPHVSSYSAGPSPVLQTVQERARSVCVAKGCKGGKLNQPGAPTIWYSPHAF